MSQAPAEVLSRVPTLTEILDLAPVPDLAEEPVAAGALVGLSESAAGHPADGWIDKVMDRLSPQMDALISSRFRDVLAPALQDAVDQALEQLREPLVEEVHARLRDVLENELRQFLAESERLKTPP